MFKLTELKRDIVIANRILAHEGVVDAFGHVSVRNPGKPGQYFLSRSRSPELVTMDDIMEFKLTGETVVKDDRKPYAERFIHGAIYEARPDVNAVIHNHAHEIIPFAVTKTPLRPLMHTTGVIGAHVPVWDIAEQFGDTNLLVVNMEQGRDLARALGDARVVLMRGHGCTVTGKSVREVTLAAIYTQVNAKLQLQAMPLGEVTYLSPGEIERTPEALVGPLAMERAWDHYATRAGAENL
jgi:ribulose-5-phosphate 4-epimerase/fuculose-1-phosphate aldolase